MPVPLSLFLSSRPRELLIVISLQRLLVLGDRESVNFLTGIALASPLSSPQQPVGQVWYRGLAHQKPDGRSPPRLIIAPAVSPATGGTNSATVWEHTICRVFTGGIACWRRSEWPG